MAKLIMRNLMMLDSFVEGPSHDPSGYFDARPYSIGIVVLRYEPL